MECDICHRDYDAERLPFLCAVDARNKAYDGRIKYLQLLLESHGLRGQIQELLTASNPPASEALETYRSKQRMAEDRTTSILEAADKLNNEIRTARDEIQARREALARRRSDLATVSNGLTERRAGQKKEVEKSTQMLRFRWAQSAEDMAGTRSFLCCEAASLYGLRRIKRGDKRYDYDIGRVPVVDLASMNCEFTFQYLLPSC